MPITSIIITTYNRTRWLEQAIKSCLDQSYKDIEIIVIDDGSSTDSAFKIVNKFLGVNYRYQTNHGLGAARNTGLSLSNGEYVQFLDDDDWFTENSILEKLGCFDADPAIEVVYSDLFLTDENGLVQSRYFDSYKRPLPTGDLYPGLIHRNFIPVHALLWKKSALVKAGGFPARSGYEDWEALIRVSEFGRFGFIDLPLGFYRQHPASLSRSFQTMFQGKLSFQKEISSSARFQILSDYQRKRLLLKFSLQQAAYGEPELVRYFFGAARSIPGDRSVEFIAQLALKLNRPILQWMFLKWSRIYRLF